MPLYEYRCTSCGEPTEVLQHMGDSPLTECPRCGGALKKVASAPALQFKGSGWYVTDYPRGGASKDTKDVASGGEASSTVKADETPTKATADAKKAS